MIAYDLPEWAFLDAHSHQGNPLGSRTVILHIRSASVIEIIDREKDHFIPVEGVLQYRFKYLSENGEERFSAVLHHCATMDTEADRSWIKENILKPCAVWFCEYCAWEDKNPPEGGFDEE